MTTWRAEKPHPIAAEAHRLAAARNRGAVAAAASSRTMVLGLILIWGATVRPAAAQGAAPAARHVQLTGAVTVTNKGISFIPSFTLGKPAVISDIAIRWDRVSFEPQFRFGTDGKPWSFLFWGRYRAITRGRFLLAVGGHPALSFKTTAVDAGGGPQEVITASRYVAGEIVATYALTTHLTVGPYYFLGHGLDPDTLKHTQFAAARANVTGVRLSDRYALEFAPQLYYLRTDGLDGYAFTSTATLVVRDVPVSIQVMINKPIRSRVPGGQDFLWNVSAIYAMR